MRILTQRQQWPFRYADNADYRGQHQAPDAEYGASMDNPDMMFPDIDTHPQYYDTGQPYDHESHSAIRSARGRPNKLVNIYRALPASAGNAHKYPLNTGDWVTPSYSYAKEHGESNLHNSPWTIVQHKARAGDLYSEGNSIHEWAYHGQPQSVRENPAAAKRRRREEVKSTPVTPEMMQQYVRHYFRRDDDNANTEFANRGWNEFNKRVESGEFNSTYDATPKKAEDWPGTNHIYDMLSGMYS